MSGPTSIRAVTFDFWNTLYADEKGVSEERTRRRAALIATAVASAHQGDRPPSAKLQERIVAILPQATRLRDAASRGFMPAERIAWVLSELGVSLQSDAIDALALELAELGAALPPTLVEGARELLAAVAGVAKVGVVSDTGLITGQYLRSIMEGDGLAGSFGALGFSDETGWSKPHADAFGPVLAKLGVVPGEAVHVGDLAETDVAGALELGMRAVWIDPRRPDADVPDADVYEALSGIARPDDPRLVRVGALTEVPAALRKLGLDLNC